MRYLVTGATGFIGRRLMRRLVEAVGPSAVTCLVTASASPAEYEATDRYRNLGITLVPGDLLQSGVATEPPPAVDVVIHLAANIDTRATETQARVNDEGTRNLLNWLRPVSRGARIVYASSVAVHDRNRRPEGAIAEESPLVPRSAYGRTKLRGERILRERAGVDGYSWTILRLPTVYGPGQKDHGLFDELTELTKRGALLGSIDWPGRTSIIHVDDVAEAVIDLAARDESAGQVFCVASDESLTVGEIARHIGRALGRPIKPVAIPPVLLGTTRWIVWSAAVQKSAPGFLRVPLWRLSLMIDDGFWFDTSKFRNVYRQRPRTLDEGLVGLLQPSPPREYSRPDRSV